MGLGMIKLSVWADPHHRDTHITNPNPVVTNIYFSFSLLKFMLIMNFMQA